MTNVWNNWLLYLFIFQPSGEGAQLVIGRTSQEWFLENQCKAFDFRCFRTSQIACTPTIHVLFLASLLRTDTRGSRFRLVGIEGDFDLSRREMSSLLQFDVSKVGEDSSGHPSEAVSWLVRILRTHSGYCEPGIFRECESGYYRKPQRKFEKGFERPRGTYLSVWNEKLRRQNLTCNQINLYTTQNFLEGFEYFAGHNITIADLSYLASITTLIVSRP